LQRADVNFNVADQFVNLDPCFHQFPVDTISENLTPLYKKPPPGSPLAPGIDRMVGCEPSSKIQVYDRVTILPDDTSVEQYILSPSFSRPVLLTDAEEYNRFQALTTEKTRVITSTETPAGLKEIFQNDFVPAVIEVDHFGAAGVSLLVKTPVANSPVAKDFWLYYADAWHPFWEAYVNGRPAPILKANLGFKAVRIPAGKSRVDFSHRSHYNEYLFFLLWAGSALFLVAVLGQAVNALATER
jgi:hypothetical protein